MINTKFIFCIMVFTTLISSVAQKSFGQQNPKNSEAANEYLQRLKKMADSVKQAKLDGKSKTGKSKQNLPSRFSVGKYGTNKTIIDNAFKNLSSTDKEKVKHYPQVPEAFRTDTDAQLFINSLQGINITADIQKFSKEKSIMLIGYLASFNATQKKAEAIVIEAKKLKSEFEKKNPNVNFGESIGKTYVGENALVYLPLAESSFTDEVINTKYISGNIEFPKENCIGKPDYVLMKNLKENKGIYSLGLNGSITIKFNNNGLVNINGPDLFVFEAGEIEPTNIDISKNGTDWINIGKIEGGTAALDIEKFVKPNEFFYYVRLTDLNTKSTIAGADIDAIAAIGAALKLNLNAAVLFDFGKSILKEEGINAVKNLANQLKPMNKAEITIEGFTDNIGTVSDNANLSLLRAKAVSAILKFELKDKTAFSYKEIGSGSSNPIAPNNSEDNRMKNRRVEIVVNPN